MTDFKDGFSSVLPELGFGGVVGFVVGYTAKKISKVVAVVLGGLVLLMVGLQSAGWVTINWVAVQESTEPLLVDGNGTSLADKVWAILVANIPFGGGFAAGFAIGFKVG